MNDNLINTSKPLLSHMYYLSSKTINVTHTLGTMTPNLVTKLPSLFVYGTSTWWVGYRGRIMDDALQLHHGRLETSLSGLRPP